MGLYKFRDDWIDNADSYICPDCLFECNSPLHYSVTATCPRCGFTPKQYQCVKRNAIIVCEEVIRKCRDGIYGCVNMTLREIFIMAGYPHLIDDMTNEELEYVRESAPEMFKPAFDFELSKRATAQ